MGTPHNNADIGQIAKNVIMPGDPNRAKLIAEKYLENYKLVSDVRGIYAFTGTYKGKEVTIMASGMGMPSMGIYSEVWHLVIEKFFKSIGNALFFCKIFYFSLAQCFTMCYDTFGGKKNETTNYKIKKC